MRQSDVGTSTPDYNAQCFQLLRGFNENTQSQRDQSFILPCFRTSYTWKSISSQWGPTHIVWGANDRLFNRAFDDLRTQSANTMVIGVGIVAAEKLSIAEKAPVPLVVGATNDVRVSRVASLINAAVPDSSNDSVQQDNKDNDQIETEESIQVIDAGNGLHAEVSIDFRKIVCVYQSAARDIAS